MKSESQPLARIVGEQLCAVVFVQDYLQFQFDGPTLNLYTLVSVRASSGVVIGDHAVGWRDALCAQIALKVKAVRFDREELIIEFANDSALLVSLRWEEGQGPEAGEFFDENVILVIEFDDPNK